MDEKTLAERQQRNSNVNRAIDWIENFILENGNEKGRFVVEESHIRFVHAICMNGLLKRPGFYRTTPLERMGTHDPPPPEQVAPLMASFVSELNSKWQSSDFIDVGAFFIWRLNWIHPFADGNGRVARLFSYFLMNMRVGRNFPGKKDYLVPVQLANDEKPLGKRRLYVDALRYADKGDLQPIKYLLLDTLHTQIKSDM